MPSPGLVVTGTNRSFSIYKVFYRVKSVSLFRFTRLLQGQISLPFSILISVFLQCEMIPSLFDVQGFYIIERFSYDLEKWCR